MKMEFNAGNIEKELKEIEILEVEDKLGVERITANGGFISLSCC